MKRFVKYFLECAAVIFAVVLALLPCFFMLHLVDSDAEHIGRRESGFAIFFTIIIYTCLIAAAVRIIVEPKDD